MQDTLKEMLVRLRADNDLDLAAISADGMIVDADFEDGLDVDAICATAGDGYLMMDALSQELQGYWVNFAKTGDPNGPGLPKWPKFQPGKITVMALGKDNKPIALPVEWRLKALTDYYAARRTAP